MKIEDPCFRCTLPDCDDKHPKCPRNVILASARRKRKAGQPLTDQETELFREYNREATMLMRARASDASHEHS